MKINRIEAILQDAYENIDKHPAKGIELSNEALALSEEISFVPGIAKAKLRLFQSNVIMGNLNTAMGMYKECLMYFSSEGVPLQDKADLLRYIGILHYKKNEYELALDYTQSSVASYKKLIHKHNLAKSLNILGCIHCKLHNYSHAFANFKECLQLKKELNFSSEQIAISYQNIALVFMDLDDCDKAMRYMKEANRLLESSEHDRYICSNLLNMGVAMGKMGDYKEAIQSLEEALLISEKRELLSYKASILSNLAELNYFNHDVDKALVYSQEGISLCKELHLKNHIFATCLITIFRCHHNNGELETAAEIGKECVSLCKDIGFDNMAMDLLTELMEVLEKLGRVNEAFNVSKALIEIQTIVFTKKNEFSNFRIQSKMELQMKEQELKLQREIVKQKEKYNQELLQAYAELDRFVGIASHDLKEPIRTINSFSNLIAKHIPEDDKIYEYFLFIRDSSQRMDTLVDDLLSYARAGKMNHPTKPIPLDNVLDFATRNIHDLIGKFEAMIIRDVELPTIQAHMTPLIQLFQNIITNGIKYNRPDVKPVITIMHQETENEHLITIKDNGMGIDSSKLKTIFDPFVRIHRKHNDMSGTGIGLTTCKRIVEQYHGRIWVTSELHKGSEFHIAFPNCQSKIDPESE